MAAPCFVTYNAATTTLSAPMSGTATSATSGTVKTLLQLATPTASKIRVIEWGYTFLSTPTAPVQIELIDAGTVFATVTAGTVSNYNDATGRASLCATGTSATGFNATAEGTITATRLLAQKLDTASYFVQQYPLGREPEIDQGHSLRIRATPTSSAAVTILAHLVWEE